MSTGFKEKMKAKLNVKATQEMKPIYAKTIESNPETAKHYKNFTYEDTIELDSRKWNEKTLAEGMFALVRYELKLLAAQATQAIQKHEKEGKKADAQKAKEDKASGSSRFKLVKDLAELRAKLGAKQKRLADITPDRKGKRKVEPKNAKEATAFDKEQKTLEGEVKKLEAEEKKLDKQHKDLEAADEKRARAEKGAKSDALPPATVAELKGLYDDMAKDIEKKLSLGLEELASGAGEKKAARQGKDAMARFKDTAKIEKLFSKPRTAISTVFASLDRALATSGDDDKKTDMAFKAANASMKKIKTDYDRVGAEAKDAIAYLIRVSEKRDVKDSATMGEFVKKISDNKTKLKGFSKDIASFDTKVTDWDNEISTRNLTLDQLRKNKRELDGTSSLEGEAKRVSTLLADLHKKFKEVESELK